MKRAKKNNKGFSLVELIVVVLIIGVLGVALAPQIMKWVDTSKKNTDINNAGVLKSAAQTALAEWQSVGGTLSDQSTLTIHIDDKSITTTADWDAPADSVVADAKSVKGYLNDIIGATSYPEAKYKETDGDGDGDADVDFIITIKNTGEITVVCEASIEATSGS